MFQPTLSEIIVGNVLGGKLCIVHRAFGSLSGLGLYVAGNACSPPGETVPLDDSTSSLR
jgi:hypothetical protein